MDNTNTNDFPILGTLTNEDASGIIARSSQIFDPTAGKSVEQRITDLDKKIVLSSGLKVRVSNETLKFE